MNLKFGTGKKEVNNEREKELVKYMQAEINMLESKLSDMEKVMNVGLPMAEMKDGIDKLEKVEKELDLYKSNSLLITASLKKLGALLDTLYEDVRRRPTLDKLDIVGKRIDNLERVVTEFSGSKNAKELANLVEVNKTLLKRVQNLENILEKQLSIGVKPLESKALKEAEKNQLQAVSVEEKPMKSKTNANVSTLLEKLLRKKSAKS